MCTAISYKVKQHYFGRNLDLEYHYSECVTITPRKFTFPFRCIKNLEQHYAMIGIATIADGFPLYYDATNEYGLSVAGLNFPGNAQYFPPHGAKQNLAPFELIPWILGKFRNISEVLKEINTINIAAIPFNKSFSLSPLHWMISDSESSVVLEQTKDGLHVYDNKIGVLTNNPPFPFHTENLKNYMHLSPEQANNNFTEKLELLPYSNGMGAIGLPGDLSSASRFVRAAFTKLNAIADADELSGVTQFFHILDTVKQTRGTARVNGDYEITQYSSCCNTRTGIYYYKTYQNSQITAVHLHHANLDSKVLNTYPLIKTQTIHNQN